MAVQNAENGVVWAVRGHSRSWAMPPFNTAHMTSYSTLIETVSIFYRFRDIASYLSKVADFSKTKGKVGPPGVGIPLRFRKTSFFHF